MNAISRRAPVALAATISASVVLASAYLWTLNLQRPWPYALAIAVVAIAWILRQLTGRPGATTANPSTARQQITHAIALSGLVLGLALSVQLLASFGAPSEWVTELGVRSQGFVLGAIVIAFANVIPKRLSTARGLALHRTAGRALVLGGIGYVLAWLLLPLAYANLGALAALGLSLVYAIARVAWMRWPQPFVSNRADGRRRRICTDYRNLRTRRAGIDQRPG